MATSPAVRLGDAVRARRKELDDISQMDVWLAGGPSNTTLTKIENGGLETLTRTTARKLDIGLQWEPGTARRIYEGTSVGLGVEPTKVDDVRQVIETSDLPDDVRRDLLERLDRDARPAPQTPPPVKPRATGTEGSVAGGRT